MARRKKYHLRFTNPISRLLRRVLKIESCYITCARRSDGGGAQAHAIMSTMAFANMAGLRYVHTPFQEIEHNNNSDDNWANQWEDFFNLGEGEIPFKELDLSKINVIELKRSRHLKFRNNTLYIVTNCHDVCDSAPNAYESIKGKLLQKYNHSNARKPQLNHSAGSLNIALHIRRGDVSANENAKRHTDNHTILNRLNYILKDLQTEKQNVSIHVYSQGDTSDFLEFQEIGAKLHLNEDIFSTFHDLRSADVLIMSKSSLSYCAALLSTGRIIYDPFWHRPMQDWVAAEEDAILHSPTPQTLATPNMSSQSPRL